MTCACGIPSAMHFALNAAAVSFGTLAEMIVYVFSLYLLLTSVDVCVFLFVSTVYKPPSDIQNDRNYGQDDRKPAQYIGVNCHISLTLSFFCGILEEQGEDCSSPPYRPPSLTYWISVSISKRMATMRLRIAVASSMLAVCWLPQFSLSLSLLNVFSSFPLGWFYYSILILVCRALFEEKLQKSRRNSRFSATPAG